MNYTAFAGARQLSHGSATTVALRVQEFLASEPAAAVLIFHDTTGEQIDFDLSGTADDIRARLSVEANPDTATGTATDNIPADRVEALEPRGRGRPRLGVVAREVTLLPRHWEWLNTQPGGASVALRKLVEAARKSHETRDRIRQAQEATHRFLTAMAGNRPHYEEALRALFAGDQSKFHEQTASWPADIRRYSQQLAAPIWSEPGADSSSQTDETRA